MTDVSNIVTQLDGDKTLLTQVLTATAGGFDLPATSALEIESLLDGDFGDEIYPAVLPEQAVHPSCVYTLTGVDTFDTDGYRLTQTDSYTLTIRTAGGVTSKYAEFETKMRAVIAKLRTSAYSIEPIDMRVSYDDKKETIVGDIDVEVTYIAQPAGGTPGNDAAELPVAFVYPVGRNANESDYANLVKQRVDDTYAIVIMTVDGNVPALMTEVRASLLGFGQTTSHFDMEYVSGQNLGGISNMEVWRELYTDGHMITET